MSRDGQIVMENVQMIYRNFAGLEGPYNRAGDRNFAVILDEKLAKDLADDGWNVKTMKVREDDDPNEPPKHFLGVSVNFAGRPPTVVMISNGNRTFLGENEVELFDHADILNTDLIINPYKWDIQGKGGIKAYLEALYVTIELNPLEQKYADMNQIPR